MKTRITEVFNELKKRQNMREFCLMKNGSQHGIIKARNLKEAENTVLSTYGESSGYYVIEE